MRIQEFFGEMALMTDEPRKANVIALGPVECLVLRRRHFNELLGSVEATLAREVERRLKMEDEGAFAARGGRGGTLCGQTSEHNPSIGSEIRPALIFILIFLLTALPLLIAV